MKMTTKQLSIILGMHPRSTYRLCIRLQFVTTREKNKLYYHFDADHPMSQSITLMTGAAKPIYTVAEIARLWQWRKGAYSTERVRQLLYNYDITIHNKQNKGFIYLSDLQKLMK
jgi:hypothetical protein